MTTVDQQTVEQITESAAWLDEINLRHYNGPSNASVRSAVAMARAAVEAARLEVESRIPLDIEELPDV